ncbi:MAG: hypothetical protein KDM91_01600 [Verrucomicrobiae bacterium]|nr:hypothetical protein [Verrucomicrobiae bacterium]MCP5539468.1 hypothetical protein [Akkermansiaceae bacterium]MCP5551712.1 hypothetical protein [Akkermansiaceae bacterium]
MQALFAIITILCLGAWIYFRHSFFAAPFVVFLSLWVQDFYPLCHFPMYSDPNESENYFYLATVDDAGRAQPLPVRKLTSITAPKVKKMFKAWADDVAKTQGKHRDELSDADRAKIGNDLLNFLRDQATKHANTLPDKLQLVEVWIVYDDDTGFSETPKVVASQPAS